MKKLLLAILFLVPAFAFAQLYHVGDIVTSPNNEKAIVFYVFDDGNHGWAMALHDYPETRYWMASGSASIPEFLQRIQVNANTVSSYSAYLNGIEGWKTASAIRDYGYENMFPAFYACDFGDGWYLPTAGQMRKLYSSEILVGGILHNQHGNWLKPRKYWTATVASGSSSITINGNDGKVEPTAIGEGYYVRPIRNVGFVSNYTNDSYYCRGDRVVDLGYDFIAENDTLISRTYTSYQGFDSIVGVNVHILLPEYALAGNMLVCTGLNTEISVTHASGQFSYNWRDDLNPSASLGSSSSLQLTNVTENHPYSVVVGQFFEQVDKYCTSSTAFDISVIETDVAISGGRSLCYNSSETLTVPEGDNLQYSWYLPSSPQTSLATGRTFETPNLTSSTTYNVSVSGGTCTGTGSITINVEPEFTVAISGDNSLCYGETASLSATASDNSRVTYSWYNATTSETLASQNTLTTSALYENAQFGIRAERTSGVAPVAENVAVGDIITTNKIVVKPSQWTDAQIQNLTAVGVVFGKDENSVRVVSIDEYAGIPWGTQRFTNNQYTTDYNVARTLMNGKEMTDAIVAYNNAQQTPTGANYVAALKAREKGAEWYLPAEGELYLLENNLANVNYGIALSDGAEIDESKSYWSSTEYSAQKAWYAIGTGTGNESKSTSFYVRPVAKYQYSELISFGNSATCRAADTHSVTVTPQQVGNIYDTIAIGETYTYRDSTNTPTEAGDVDFIWTFHNANACDSIIYISLYVTPRNVTVTPLANQQKNCGELDPVLQYTLSENVEVTGQLSRESGESVGTYAYTLGTLDAGDNYVLVLAGNAPRFEILATEGTEESVSACGSYEWHGNIYTRGGDYYDTIPNETGCASIATLHLTLHNPEDTTFISARACSSYTWTTMLGSRTYNESGEYSWKLYSHHGCDSVVTLRLTIVGSQTVEVDEDACNSFEWNGRTYYESGDITRRLITPEGCDSTVTLHLTITYMYEIPQVETTPNTLCSGYNGSIVVTSPLGDDVEYSIDGVNFQTSPTFTGLEEGVYTVTVRRGACTSSVEATVNTTVTRPLVVTSETTTSVCLGDTISLNSNGSSSGSEYSYLWTGPDGLSSTQANVEIENATTANSGEYELTITNLTTGCNRSATVVVAVNSPTSGIDEQEGCTSYTWIDGITYTASTNEPTIRLTNAAGCDSIVTLHLTINQAPRGDTSAVACESFEWYGQEYTESGDYDHTIEMTVGCDSIVTLHLTINELPTSDTSVVACDSFIWYGQEYTESDDYAHIVPGEPCNSIINLHLTINSSVTYEISAESNGEYTWNDTTYTISGDYVQTFEAANGCDSVVTLHLTIGTVDVEASLVDEIHVYPNPATEKVFVEGENIRSVSIMDVVGREMKQIQLTDNQVEINLLDVPNGEYLIRIETGGATVYRRLVVAR